MQYSGQDSAAYNIRVQFNPEDGRRKFFQKAKNPQLMYSKITPTFIHKAAGTLRVYLLTHYYR
jgi:hypothetical protein